MTGEQGPRPGPEQVSSLPPSQDAFFLGMNDASTSSLRISRRTFLKATGAAALGLAVPGLRNEASMARSNEISAVTYETLDPEQMKASVLHNIEQFNAAPVELLAEMADKAAVRIPVNGFGQVAAPAVSYPEATGHEAQLFFAKSDDAKKSFPNLGILFNPYDEQGNNYQSEIQGIYLGRTEHPYESSIGPITVDVLYMGCFFGDPESGNEGTKVVLPLFYGWKTGDPETSAPAAINVRGEDSPIVFPTPVGSEKVTIMDSLSQLDQYIGTGVWVTELGYPNVPGAELEQAAASRGYPGEFYSSYYGEGTTEVHKNIHNTFKALTADQARADGYIAYTTAENPEPVEISDAFTGGATKEDLIGALPKPESILEKDALTLDDIRSIGKAHDMSISPTSVSAVEEPILASA